MKKLIIFLQIQEGGAFESGPYHSPTGNAGSALCPYPDRAEHALTLCCETCRK